MLSMVWMPRLTSCLELLWRASMSTAGVSCRNRKLAGSGAVKRPTATLVWLRVATSAEFSSWKNAPTKSGKAFLACLGSISGAGHGGRISVRSIMKKLYSLLVTCQNQDSVILIPLRKAHRANPGECHSGICVSARPISMLFGLPSALAALGLRAAAVQAILQ